MRIVIQRVSHASVTINGQVKSAIGPGLVLLVGIEEADGPEDVEWMAHKVINLRIFDDENGHEPLHPRCRRRYAGRVAVHALRQ